MPLPLFAVRHLLFKPLIINSFLNYLWQVRRARAESSHEKARLEHQVCNLVLILVFHVAETSGALIV